MKQCKTKWVFNSRSLEKEVLRAGKSTEIQLDIAAIDYPTKSTGRQIALSKQVQFYSLYEEIIWRNSNR